MENGFQAGFLLGGQLVGGGLGPASHPVSLLFRLASTSPLFQAPAPDLSSQNSELYPEGITGSFPLLPHI